MVAVALPRRRRPSPKEVPTKAIIQPLEPKYGQSLSREEIAELDMICTCSEYLDTVPNRQCDSLVQVG